MMHLHPHRRAASGNPGERGETLIELMATVVLMGVSIVALVGALIGVITTSNEHRRATRAGNEAVTVVESLRSLDYIPCATATSYNAPLTTAVGSMPRGYTWSITGFQRLQNASASTPVWVNPSGGCTTGNDTGAQRIKVTISSTGSASVSRSLTIVKRKKICPDAAPADPEAC